MLDFVYTLLIAPLEYWMHAAIVWGYGYTANWGWAIVVMSLAVNFVILPIYIKAEKWQEGERALRKSFEDKEAMIKRTFKGQERFAMISTMHRQAGYSPLLSLRSSIGFFLQIPFFFAAYHFLSHFAPLAGVSFFGLSDLSKPDGLISLGSFSLNVMPFVMTAVNLTSALVYAHNLTRRDKMQLYGMAALFLVLLYDAASALVLYWTCNNIFSLCKNIVYDLIGRFAVPLKRAFGRFATAPGAAVLQAKDVPVSVDRLSIVPFVLWGAGAVLALLTCNQIEIFKGSANTSVSLVSDAFFLAALAVSFVAAVKLRLWKKHWLTLLLMMVVAYYGVRVWGLWFFNGSSRRGFAMTGGFLFLIPVLTVLNAGCGLGRILFAKASSLRSTKFAGTLMVPAAVWLTVLLGAYLPIQAYSTAPEAFSPAAEVLAKSLLWTAVIGVGLWIFTFLAQLVRARNFAGYFLGALASVMTVYAFVLPLDAGTIDAFQLEKPQKLFAAANLLLDVAAVTVTLGAFALAVKKGGARWIKTVFVACTLLAALNAVNLLWQTRGQWNRAEEARAATELPAYTERLFGFSKTGENIVVVMLDAFTGSHMPLLLEGHPQLAHALRGFVWYEDTVSAGNNTQTGVASLLCGEPCRPNILNENGSGNLAEKINRNYASLIDRLSGNFDISIHERNWLEPERVKKYAGKDALLVRYLSESYTDRYAERNNIELARGNSDAFLLAVSLYSAVPWSGKNLVYKDGQWIESLMGKKETVLLKRAVKDWAIFEQLPDLSNTDAKRSTFKFIDTEVTHFPWFMDPQTCRITDKPDRSYTDAGVPKAHLATEMCALQALGRWFDWMRREGVWDNTTVVVVSDHSASDDPAFESLFKGHEGGVPARANSLLLVKRGAGEAPLTVDDTPMTVPALASLWTGIKPETTTRTYFEGQARGDIFLTHRLWEVNGPMRNPDSWKRLQ